MLFVEFCTICVISLIQLCLKDHSPDFHISIKLQDTLNNNNNMVHYTVSIRTFCCSISVGWIRTGLLLLREPQVQAITGDYSLHIYYCHTVKTACRSILDLNIPQLLLSDCKTLQTQQIHTGLKHSTITSQTVKHYTHCRFILDLNTPQLLLSDCKTLYTLQIHTGFKHSTVITVRL